MKEKIFIVIICCCLISFLFNTTLIFSNLESGLTSISASSDILVDDFALFGAITYTLDHSFNAADYIRIQAGYEEGLGYILEVIVIYSGNEWYETEQLQEVFYFTNERSRDLGQKLINSLLNVAPVEYEGAFAGVINAVQYIAFILTFVFSVLILILVIIFDSAILFLQFPRAFLRIIGLQ